MINKKNILVIGGAGHVGSNLLEHLLRLDNIGNLISLDNYSNGSFNNHISGVTYVEGEAKDISKHVTIKFDYIVHLGEFARIEQSFSNYYQTVNSNIMGTIEVVKFCIDNGIKLIYSASSAITSMNEADIVNAPYTITKYANVELIKSLSQYYNLEYAIVYFYNVYGPRERGNGSTATVVEKFLQHKFDNKKVIINLPGTQMRNFTDVRDIVEGVKRVMLTETGDGYYIGNPEAYSILELADMIGVKYSMGKVKLGNRSQSQVDISKMRKLGWKPNYNLQSYIADRLDRGF